MQQLDQRLSVLKKTYLNYGDFIVPGEGCAESFGVPCHYQEKDLSR